MPLLINIKQLENGQKHFRGHLELADLDVDPQDELIKPSKGLDFDFTAEIQGKNILTRGYIGMSFQFECARCLNPFEKEIEFPHWSQLIPFSGEEAVPVDNDCIDLTPFLREDMLLSLPQHPLCAKECQGMDTPTEKSPDFQSIQPKVDKQPSAWTALDQLHLE